jgi:hypothetical protein
MKDNILSGVYGWFGEPWASSVCYDEYGRLLEEIRKPFPVDESCLLCTEKFDEKAGDSGVTIHSFDECGVVAMRYAHKECQLLNVTGMYTTLDSEADRPERTTIRQKALEMWRQLRIEWFDRFPPLKNAAEWPADSQWCPRHWAPAPLLNANGLGAAAELMRIFVDEIAPRGIKSADSLNRELLKASPICCRLGDERMYELWGHWPPIVRKEDIYSD